MKYRVYNIEYDYGDESPLHDENRPIELVFNIEDKDFNPSEDLADLVSDATGFCIFGCQFEEKWCAQCNSEDCDCSIDCDPTDHLCCAYGFDKSKDME
jgi:hypothetical protein